MKLKTVSQEEIESMPYDDLAYVILREKGKKMKTVDIFKCICDLLNMDENAYNTHIADFFTLLATEKRFVQLPKGYWDLIENHSVDTKLKDLEETEEDEDIELEDKDTEEIEETEDYYDEDDNDEDIDDGLKDLVVIDEMEEEVE